MSIYEQIIENVVYSIFSLLLTDGFEDHDVIEKLVEIIEMIV